MELWHSAAFAVMESTSPSTHYPFALMDLPLAVVLAAGKGTRMNADTPKVLCRVLGRPMVDYVLDALDEAGVGGSVVVVGYRAEEVKNALANRTNEENQKLYDRMIDTMLNKLGYCRTCAQKTIEYFCTQEDEK